MPEPVKACAAGLAAHRRGSQRAARLRTRALPAPAHGAPEVCAARRCSMPCPSSHRCPRLLLERSLVAPGLLAQIVVEQVLRSSSALPAGVDLLDAPQVWLPRQTMAEWVELAAEWLRPSTSRSARRARPAATCRSMKRRSAISRPATARPSWVTSGPAASRAAMSSSIGRRAAPPRAWRTSSPWTSAAPSSATATTPTTALPGAAAGRSCSPAAWPMCGASFTTPAKSAPKAPGWFLRHIQNLYALEDRTARTREPARSCAPAERPAKAARCWRGSIAPWCG